MAAQEVNIAPRVRIVLKPDSELLDEVVIVAYGTASRASITGAVASVDAKKIEKRPVTNAASALEGAAPGVQVNNTYGEPGSSPEIRIRGFGSINGSNAPLIVVDGVPYEGRINDISSNDIESMSVLKDAASAALFGNKAANGVILITTKKGKSNRLNLRINVNQGIYNRGVSEYERMGINDWMETQWAGYQRYYIVNGQTPEAAGASATNNLIADVIKVNIFDKADNALFDTNGKFVGNVLPGYTDLDWNDQLERNGYRQEYGVSADTAGEKHDLFSSVSYLDEKGYISSSDYQRLSGRVKANFTPTKWFKTGVNISASSQKSNYATSAEGIYYINPFYAARMMAPVYSIYEHDANGNIVVDDKGEKQYNLHQSYLDGRHIIYELKNDINQTYTNTITAQAYATIDFLNDFSFTVKGNLYTRDATQKNYNNPVIGDGAGNNGRLSKYFRRDKDYSLAQELFWSHSYGEHNIDALFAHEAYKHAYDYDYTSKAKQKLSGDNTNLSNFSEIVSSEGYKQMYTTESYLGRARYNYMEKYFFDASFRRDGSSRFHKDNRWGNFWSVGASWMFSDENFMRSFDWINNMKLRASYGEVGNDIGVGYYAYKALYLSGQNSGLGAYYKQQNEARDLKWETSATFDVAIEGRLFDKLNFSLGYFDKRSNDLLFSVYNPLSAGANSIAGSTASGMSTINKNIGSVSNRGIEFSFDVDVLKNNDWQWNVGGNLTYIKNKILELPDGEDILNGSQQFSEGKSIYEFYTYRYAGVDQMTGRSLYNADPEKVEAGTQVANGNIFEINGKYYTYDTTHAGKEWCGSALPDVQGSISTSLSYKAITLSALGTFSIGGKVYDSTYQSLMSMSINGVAAQHKDLKKAWAGVPDGMTEDSPNRIDAGGIPRADLSSQATYSTGMSSRWLQNGSYFVLKNVNLNYSFPKRITNKLGIEGLDIYGTVENAFTLTHLKGMNPQYSFRGTIDNTFVTARVYSFGLTLKL